MIAKTKFFSNLFSFLFFLFLIIFIVLPLISFFLTAFSGQPSGIFNIFISKNYSISLTSSFYSKILTNSYYLKSIYDTIILALSVTVLSFILSLPISYGLARTNMPLKSIIRVLLGIGISIPGFIVSYDLIIISTNTKLLPFSIYSYSGLLAVMTLSTIPFMVMYITLAFDNLDYRLIEAAYVNGVSKIKTFFKITLPLLMPGFVSGWVIVFLLTSGTLSVPLLLAPPTFPIITELAYTQLFSFFNWGTATALLSVLLIINLIIISTYTLYQKRLSFSTIGGKGFHSKIITKKWIIALITIYSFLFAILPIAEVGILGLSSFSSRWVMTPVPTSFTLSNYSQAISLYPFSVWATLIISISAAILAVAISFISTYFVKTGLIKGKRLIDLLILVIFSLSSVMIGLTYLTVFSNPITGFLINSVPIALLIGYVFGRLGYSTRALDISVNSISKSLFEAAKIMGKSSFESMRKIIFPLIMPGIIEGFLLVFIRSTIDYGSTIMLAPYSWFTLALGSYQFISTGEIAQGAALGFIILIINIPIMIYLYWRRGKTFHEQAFLY
ncbi:MAG: ABC transporter permease [Thermoplasmata archaeon]|nr:iron ABC transporter permease [Thermoplasmata archaeon]